MGKGQVLEVLLREDLSRFTIPDLRQIVNQWMEAVTWKPPPQMGTPLLFQIGSLNYECS